MPVRRRRAPVKRRRPAVRRPRRRGLMAKRKNNVGEFASLSCARTLTIVPSPGVTGTVTDTMYHYNQFQLKDYPRAVAVAQGYQHYRITGIKLTFTPAYDTYQQNTPGATANTQKPYLYYMIDKGNAIPNNITLEGLKTMGARPIRFDEKPVSITWRPSVLTGVGDADNLNPIVASMYKVSPWLSTCDLPGSPTWLPSTVDHLGVFWYVDQPGASVGETTVYVQAELQFQFKKPCVSPTPGAPSAIGIKYPALDNSPDGVEGDIEGVRV